ncbi:MAG: DUF3800 domain-containing protein [Brevundimonas sp.]|uniref:DUF3800 domain-containing protein n=1 Tax=Brevundimonas sp. TaxID=1871086 RepID=UPI00391BC173
MIDVDEMRAPLLALHRLPGVDTRWTLYYDETNNIRRLRVSDTGFNVAEPACFVLGGIVHAEEPRELAISSLRAAVKAQPSATELKLKHIGTGDALDLLASRHLGAFLAWLRAENLLLHWSVLDPVYWSIVDIIDSILIETAPALLGHAPRLKSDLTVVLRQDLRDLAALFHTFDYPDVSPEKANDFIEALRTRVEHASGLEPFSKKMLLDVLSWGRGIAELPFLTGETSGVLIDSFADFYRHRFYLLPEARHVLDTETEIIARLEAIPLSRYGRPFQNFRFVERSHDEPAIQVADIVTGLLGKVFTWLRDTSPAEVSKVRASLTSPARENHAALMDLMSRSIAACPAFSHAVTSGLDQAKTDLFLTP